RSRRHKLSYNDKATLNNLVRISELHQKQSHWTSENDLCGTPEKLAPVGGFTWACGASVRISRTDKMYRIAIVWPEMMDSDGGEMLSKEDSAATGTLITEAMGK